jgi:hypothetical protein
LHFFLREPSSPPHGIVGALPEKIQSREILSSAHSTNTSPTRASWPPDFAPIHRLDFPVGTGKAAILPRDAC